MISTRNLGRLVGIFVLTQFIGGILVNFILTKPLFGEPGFLISASAHRPQIAISAILGIAFAVMSVVTAVILFRVVNQSAKFISILLIALSTVSLAASVVEQMNVMSMVSLSDAYAEAELADQAGFVGLRGVVAAARNSSHYIGLLVAGFMFFVFYATLYRGKLVPRILAMFGMAAAALQMVSVSMPLFGHPIVFVMLAPIGICQLLLGFWFLAKGFPKFDKFSIGPN